MIYDVLECEEVLIDEGYIVVRPEERLYVVKKFGKVWVLITGDDKEVVKQILDKVKDEEEMRRMFYSIEVVEIS